MQQRFDEFLDYVCGGIISKRERENVRNELFDHLMCTYECNLARGMDEDRAATEAENSMGDRNVVRTRLEQVHASFPELEFKSALTLVIVGFFFASFQITLFSGMDILLKLLGQSMMIAGVFCLRKAHKKLGLSFAAIIGQYIFSGASTVLTPISENHPLPLFILSLLGAVCGAAFWLFFAGGLTDLAKKCGSAKGLHLPLCAASNIILYAFNCAAYTYMFVSDTTYLNADNAPVFGVAVMAVVILDLIITIAVLRRTNKFLYENGHEYGAESSGLKKAAITICSFALVIAACAGFDAYRLTRKAEVEPYSTEDIAMDAGERAKIESTLADYGIDKEILKLLPNSEIMRFKDTADISELSYTSNMNIRNEEEIRSYLNDDGDHIYQPYSVRLSGEDSVCRFDNYAYCVTDTSGRRQLICCIELKSVKPLEGNKDIKTFVDCLEFQKSDSNSFCVIRRSNDSLLILTEENGRMKKNKPLSLRRSTDSLGNTAISNVEFQCKKGMKIFYIADISESYIPERTYQIYYDISYIHRNKPTLWISERTPEAQINPQVGDTFCSIYRAIRTMYVPYLKSEESDEPTTESEETTERVIHGNSIEEMLAS